MKTASSPSWPIMTVLTIDSPDDALKMLVGRFGFHNTDCRVRCHRPLVVPLSSAHKRRRVGIAVPFSLPHCLSRAGGTGAKQRSVRLPVARGGRRCLVCRMLRTLPRRHCLDSTYQEDLYHASPHILNPRFRWATGCSTRRNTGHTRTDAAAAAWHQLPCCVCSRSRPRSGPY
jgi:hypothetical protein